MEPRRRLIRQTTTRGRAGRPTLGLCSAIADSDLPGARLNLAVGGEPNREALKLPGIAGRLSATAIAVRSDSGRDELLFLPWLLDRGGNIGEIDSRGRTLLHHAQTRTVALHLLERGVPVANDMRDALLDAFRAPVGTGTFDRDLVLAAPTVAMREPRILGAVRKQTATQYRAPLSLWVPQSRWQDILPVDVAEAMVGAGLGQPASVAHARDPLFGAFGATGPADIRLNAAGRLFDAMKRGDTGHARALLEMGAYDGRRTMPGIDALETGLDGYAESHSAVALAAEFDSYFGASPKRSTTDLFANVGKRGALHLLPLFAGIADFSGVHGPEGQTLLHHRLAPVVVDWLVERGAPYAVADDDGNVPETSEVWAEDAWAVGAAAIYARHRLQTTLPDAGQVHTLSRRRL
jgi:hypothetical protein